MYTQMGLSEVPSQNARMRLQISAEGKKGKEQKIGVTRHTCTTNSTPIHMAGWGRDGGRVASLNEKDWTPEADFT